MTEMMTTARLGAVLSDLAGEWALDPTHTSVEISVRHMMVATVRGRMQASGGTLHIDGDDPLRSWVEVELDAASIDTGNADRDAHLRSADFLDVEHFPTLQFRSISIDEQPGGTYSICGDLTIRGVTRPAVLQAEFGGAIRDPFGLERLGFSASTAIDRSEFGLTWNAAIEGGGLVLSDRMKASVDAEFTRKPTEG